MKTFIESKIQEQLFIIDCVEKELAARLEQNPKISKEYIVHMQRRIHTARKAIAIYEARISHPPIEIICQECSQRQEVFWDSKIQAYEICKNCHIDSTFFTKVGA